MTDPDDLDALAAEYALGTLDPEERALVAARRRTDPALERAVRSWETRFGPLAEAAEEIQPPAGLFESIERRLFKADASSQDPMAQPMAAALSGGLRRWRAAAGAAALAACLALGFGLWEAGRTSAPDRVALLQRSPDASGFVLTLDARRRVLVARPVAAAAAAGKSYELWLIAKGAAPRAYGLLDPRRASVKPIEGDLAVAEQATWAVSLEPEGGSKTGAPTGPVLFSGRFTRS